MPTLSAAATGFLKDLVPAPGAERRMGVLTLAQSLGTGLFLTSGAIFFTRTVGLSPESVSVAMSVAGLCGFLATVPGGRVADRFGARRPLAASYILLAVLFVGYAFVDNIAAFAAVACAIAVCETVGSPLRAALTHALFGSARSANVRARMRSLFNLGFTGGAGLAGVALATDSRAAFVLVVTANAVLQFACGILALRLRPSGPEAVPATERSWAAFRDGRFLLATVLTGILELFQPVLAVGVPLWIVNRTDAPVALVAVLTVVNTVLVVLLQVAVGKGSDTVSGSGRLLLRAGLLMAMACCLFAGSGGTTTTWTVVLLIAGTVVMTIGELAQSAGGWGLSFGLPPEGRMGEYQGVFGLGRGLQQFFGPALVIMLPLGMGTAGWLLLAAVFLVSGLIAMWAFARDKPSGRNPSPVPTPSS
ncbi:MULTISPECIES: MFS transporter [unclassified Streptomyces]|uniref:MFS transporter n=1 Tax=unclassified Streptomyces TaxID=2593676 RepID=UPI00339FE64D